MHILYLLLKRDFYLGLNKIKKSFSLMFFINLFILIYPIYFFSIYTPKETFSFWDVIGKTIGGVQLELVKEHIFEFPYGWLLLQLCVASIVGTYIKDDLFSHSAFVRIRAQSIWKLWISKIIFCIVIAFIFYVALFSLTWLLWKFSHPTIDNWSMYSKNLIDFTKLDLSYNQTVMFTIFLNFGGTLCITTIYSTLCLFIKTVYSYMICASLLFLSVFSNHTLLIGNTSMIVRHPLFGESFLSSIYLSFIIQIILILFFVILGGFYLSKLEIVGDNQEEK